MIKRVTSLPIGGIAEEATIYRRGISPIFDSYIPPLSAASQCNPASEKAIRAALDELNIGTLSFVNEGTGTAVFKGYSPSGDVAYFKSLETSGNDITSTLTVSGLIISAKIHNDIPNYIELRETGVAGGNRHFSNTIELSSIKATTGALIGRISNGDMIGRISLKCLEPMHVLGQEYNIGTANTSISSIAFGIKAVSGTGFMFDFSYGPLLTSNEFAYFNQDDELMLYNDVNFQNSDLIPITGGKIGINILYDHAYWIQDSSYALGNGNDLSILKLELDTETSSDKLSYLLTEAEHYGSTSDSSRYIYALDAKDGIAVERFDTTHDTTSMIERGNLAYSTEYLHGQVQHSSTDLYAFGGRVTTSGTFSDITSIQKLTFASDTSNAVFAADLTRGVEAAQSWKSTAKAFLAGGQTWSSGSMTLSTSGASALTYNEYDSIQSFEFSTDTVANETATLISNKSNGSTITDSLITYIVNGSSYETLSGLINSVPKMSTYNHSNGTIAAGSNDPIYSAHSQFPAKNSIYGFLYGGSAIHSSIEIPMTTIMKMSLSNNTFFVSDKTVPRDLTIESGDMI